MDLVFASRDPDEHHQIVLVSGRPEQIGFSIVNQLSFRADGSASRLAALGLSGWGDVV